MSLAFHGFGGNGFGKKTETAGTVIDRIVPPNVNGFTRVSTLKVTAAGTAHVLTALRPIARTTLAAAAAAGQAVIGLTASLDAGTNTLAANDILLIKREADGITRKYVVSSVSTLDVTLSANLGTGLGLAAGDKVWNMGVAADTDPATGEAHPAFAVGASAQTSLSDDQSGVVASIAKDDPILLQDNNATAAGSIDQVSYGYTRE